MRGEFRAPPRAGGHDRHSGALLRSIVAAIGCFPAHGERSELAEACGADI